MIHALIDDSYWYELMLSLLLTPMATYRNIYRYRYLHGLVKLDKKRKVRACYGCTEGRCAIRKDGKGFSRWRRCSRKAKGGCSR